MDDTTHDGVPDAAGAISDPVSPIRPDLGLVLSGELPCISCRYDLSGISITGLCPECGTPVRATLLATVDPEAGTLEPLTRPRLAALGLVVWAAAAFLAVLVIWALRLGDAINAWTPIGLRLTWLGVLVPIFVGLSGIGSIVLWRPHRRVPGVHTALAVLATVLYGPLVWMMWRLHGVIDRTGSAPYVSPRPIDAERTRVQGVILVLVIVIALLLRPSVRVFAGRSVLLRTGELSRQSLLAFSIAAMLMLFGVLLRLGSISWSISGGYFLDVIGLVFLAIGSVLVTVGLASFVLDSVRLYPVLRAGPRTLLDVVGRGFGR